MSDPDGGDRPAEPDEAAESDDRTPEESTSGDSEAVDEGSPTEESAVEDGTNSRSDGESEEKPRVTTRALKDRDSEPRPDPDIELTVADSVDDGDVQAAIADEGDPDESDATVDSADDNDGTAEDGEADVESGTDGDAETDDGTSSEADEDDRITETDHIDLQEGWEEYEERLQQDDADSETQDEDEQADDGPEDPVYDRTDDEVYKTVRDPDTTPIERKAGPHSDREQPLTEHIEEMVKRLGIVIAIAGVVSLIAFPFAEDVITFLWYSVLPEGISQPHVYHPLELIMTQLKTASLAGLIIALPVFVYETYAFMKPGLYPHERRYYLAAVPTSLILALVGVTFAYFIVLPTVMTYFLYYSQDVVDIAFALGQTFNLILILMGYLALVFQIPLFIMLAIMMGLASREWMEETRLIFWGVFAGLSFLFSPDPTGMAPLIVAATMIVLFEGTLLLLRWTERGK